MGQLEMGEAATEVTMNAENSGAISLSFRTVTNARCKDFLSVTATMAQTRPRAMMESQNSGYYIGHKGHGQEE
jgi:Flp pilus assembly protein CpaB